MRLEIETICAFAIVGLLIAVTVDTLKPMTTGADLFWALVRLFVMTSAGMFFGIGLLVLVAYAKGGR